LRASGWASFRDWIRSSLPTATSVGTPGELLHIDIKKLGKINGAGHRVSGRRQSQNANRRQRRKGGPAGWEYVQVCVDDATRLAYAEVLPDEKAITAVGFLRRAIAFYARHGIHTQRVMTDNGACYRSIAHVAACRALGIRHVRTRPYRPHQRQGRTLLRRPEVRRADTTGTDSHQERPIEYVVAGGPPGDRPARRLPRHRLADGPADRGAAAELQA
jgi:transposase InsO family protein